MSNLQFRTSLGGRWVVVALLLAPLTRAAAQRPAPPPYDPVLGPGDALRVDVWRHPELSGEFVVAPDSALQHPVYQVVKVAGVPLAVVKQRLDSVLARLDKVRVIRRDSAIVINLGSGYSRYAALPIASGDQVLVARRSSFNALRDVLYPLASLTAAVAAVLAYSRYR